MRGLQALDLAVLAGDAHAIVREKLPAGGVSELFVNFPQPPQVRHRQPQALAMLAPTAGHAAAHFPHESA